MCVAKFADPNFLLRKIHFLATIFDRAEGVKWIYGPRHDGRSSISR